MGILQAMVVSGCALGYPLIQMYLEQPFPPSCGIPKRGSGDQRDAPKMRAGNITMARSSEKTPSTAIPSRRNGSDSGQTNGQRTSARIATDQQITKRISQNSNFIMEPLLVGFIPSGIDPARSSRHPRGIWP